MVNAVKKGMWLDVPSGGGIGSREKADGKGLVRRVRVRSRVRGLGFEAWSCDVDAGGGFVLRTPITLADTFLREHGVERGGQF